MSRHCIFMVLLGAALVQPAWAALPATVVSVDDGDTLTVVADGQAMTLDLGDIDAPEDAQAFAGRARQSLVDLCEHRRALLEEIEVGKTRRISAHVRCAGVDASQEQVRRGMARVDASDLPRGSTLPQAQAEAQAAQRGLWAAGTAPASAER